MRKLGRSLDAAHARAPLPWLRAGASGSDVRVLRAIASARQRPAWGWARRAVHLAAWGAALPVVGAWHARSPGGWLGSVVVGYRDNIDPASYHRYGLRRASHARRGSGYLLPNELSVLLLALNRGLATGCFDDKARFVEGALRAGLPVPPCPARVDHGRFVPAAPGLALPHADLVLKPARSYGGRGVTLLRWSDARDAWWFGGAWVPEDRVVNVIGAHAGEGEWLVQERVHNHADLSPLVGEGTSTVRVVTHRRDSVVDPLMAALRLPAIGRFVDNFDAGGVAAPVDISSGRVGPARRKKSLGASIVRHPDSGAPIEGVVLPWWDRVLSTVATAHVALGDVPFIGWDVVIADEGPCILEANTVWCGELWQLTQDRPLGETEFPARYLAEARARGVVS